MINTEQKIEPTHIEVEYVRGAIIYNCVRIELKNWVEHEEIRYRNKLVKVVETEFGFPPELAGPCLIVLGYVTGSCMPRGFAEPIKAYDERKELSDLIKKNYSAKAIFHINGKPRPEQHQLAFDF